MRIIRWTSLSLALAAAALVAGCGPMYTDGGYGRGPRDPYYDRYSSVQGTVESVSPRDRLIVVDPRGTDSRYLRDDRYRRDDRRYGDRVYLYYDDRTTVEYQGRTFRPEDLEPGDRIQVSDLDNRGDRLIAQDIEVLYDVSSGPGGYYDPSDPSDSYGDLRGTVRFVNTRDRTVEIEPAGSRYDSSFNTGRSGVVVVRYNSGTSVEYQGRRYEPGNLEQGDVVEVQARRDPDGLLLAERIVVVGESPGR
jgi:hypothetical protein